MFVITLILLVVGGVVAFLTMFLNFDVPVATVEGFEEVMACIF